MAGWSASLNAMPTTRTTAVVITPETTRNVDTARQMVTAPDGSGGGPPPDYGWGPPVPPAGGVPPRARRRRWPVVLAVLASAMVVLGFVSWTIRIPYDTVAPGETREVNGMVTVSDHPVYPTTGKVMFTTVSVRSHVNLVEALVGWADPDVDVVSERKIRGSIPPEQYKRLNVEAMGDSKTAAEMVVLNQLGYTDLGAGAEVVTTQPGSPAAEVLKPGDVIVAVDGTPVSTTAEAVAAIQAKDPGQVITLRILRGGQPVEVTAELANGDAGQPLLGVRMTTEVKLPFPITIDSGRIEGPSAGLAYALELLDYLTPGELTGGSAIAATGELGADGKVRPVGGIAQKTATVREAGVELFLVPQENYAEAEAHAGGLEVRAVATFDEALRSLGSLPDSNALALAQPPDGPA